MIVREAGALILATLAFSVGSVAAQVVEPPPRPSRPLFGSGQPRRDQVRHELTLDGNLLGGYEDNVAPLGRPVAGASVRPSANLGLADLTLRYGRQSTERGLSLSGKGSADYASTYHSAGLRTNYGADIRLRGWTSLGRHAKVMAYQRIHVSPFVSLGLFGGLNGSGSGSNGFGLGGATLPLPDATRTNALIEGDIRGYTTTVLVDRKIGRRTTASGSYAFDKQMHADRMLLDNRSHSGRFSVSRQIGRTGNLRASYAPAKVSAMQRGFRSSMQDHSIDGGLVISRSISRTRTFNLSVVGGGTYVDDRDQVHQQYWLPTAYGDVSLDVGRSWTAAADWRLGATVVPSTAFQPYRFQAHSIVASIGGYLGDRVELVLSGGTSNGAIADNLVGSEGSFLARTGSVQLRLAVTDWWSAIVSANHYQARLSGAAAAAFQTSAHLHRNTLIVGFSWSHPIIGGIERPEGARERN